MNNEAEKLRLIAFEVTRRCRFNCRHCRAEAVPASAGMTEPVPARDPALREPKAGEKELTTEQCERILASVAEFNKCVIILTGGEPMERDDIYELIRYGRGLGLQMVMATCGYAIDDAVIAGLKEAGISALSISLDGACVETHDTFRQTEGAFDLAVGAAKAARRAGMRFQINTTITKGNVTEVPMIAELCEKLGVYCFNPFILVPTGRGKEIEDAVLDPAEYEALLNELLRIKLKSKIEVRVTCGPQFARLCRQKAAKSLTANVNGCMAGRGFGFISCRGDVQTCGFLNISAGNLIENNFNFAKIWMESEFLEEIRNLSAYKGNCRACEYVGLCRGCRARAYTMSGDYLAADPICSYKGRGQKTEPRT